LAPPDTGIAWQHLPSELGFGSGVACWRRLDEWQRAGVWERLHALLLERLAGRERDRVVASGRRLKPTTHALADDALRAAELTRDLGVAALLEMVGRNRLALLGSEPLEERDSRSACRRLEDLDRLVIELDRLHRECAPCLILYTTAA
jgi:transposase